MPASSTVASPLPRPVRSTSAGTASGRHGAGPRSASTSRNRVIRSRPNGRLTSSDVSSTQPRGVSKLPGVRVNWTPS